MAVIREYLRAGVSACRADGQVKTLGLDDISTSQVSVMAKTLDAEVTAFRPRPLDTGPYSYYVWLDTLSV